MYITKLRACAVDEPHCNFPISIPHILVQTELSHVTYTPSIVQQLCQCSKQKFMCCSAITIIYNVTHKSWQ